jgi:polyhydroxyalkanoate synthesis regulator phasin
MSDEERSLREQVDEITINVRNEMIIQSANVIMAGQQLMRAGLGLALLSKDELQALLSRASERGEIGEEDARKALDALRQRSLEQAQALDESRVEMTEKASIALSDSLATILKTLKLPGISLPGTAPAPAEQAKPTASNGDTAA